MENQNSICGMDVRGEKQKVQSVLTVKMVTTYYILER